MRVRRSPCKHAEVRGGLAAWERPPGSPAANVLAFWGGHRALCEARSVTFAYCELRGASRAVFMATMRVLQLRAALGACWQDRNARF